MKYVLEQDKAAFVRLIGVSVLQSAASSFVAPSLRALDCQACTQMEDTPDFTLTEKLVEEERILQVVRMMQK
ncbi:hypothetical protein Lser_V15G16593 [Lactuca serriola]